MQHQLTISFPSTPLVPEPGPGLMMLAVPVRYSFVSLLQNFEFVLPAGTKGVLVGLELLLVVWTLDSGTLLFYATTDWHRRIM